MNEDNSEEKIAEAMQALGQRLQEEARILQEAKGRMPGSFVNSVTSRRRSMGNTWLFAVGHALSGGLDCSSAIRAGDEVSKAFDQRGFDKAPELNFPEIQWAEGGADV